MTDEWENFNPFASKPCTNCECAPARNVTTDEGHVSDQFCSSECLEEYEGLNED